MVTLTDGDLEQIPDAVTMAIEEKWVSLEEHQKTAISAIQEELRTLQLNIDTIQTSMVQG